MKQNLEGPNSTQRQDDSMDNSNVPNIQKD
jgi:hypothetical protein